MLNQNARDQRLADAAESWLAIVCSYEFGKPSDDDIAHADAELAARLTEAHIAGEFVECYPSDCGPQICVVFADGTSLLIDATTGEFSRS
jgi:hypothetical protein